jgi:tRNA threonylcarbamoyladenosine modification (KEOPS) complex Cgi121 subunit
MKSVGRRIKVFPVRGKFVAVFSGHLLSSPDELVTAVSGGQGRATVQVFDADSIAGVAHLLHSVALAISGWEAGTRFTRRFELELLCYAAADHQISEAIKKVGVGRRTSRVVFVALAGKGEEAAGVLRGLAGRIRVRPDPEVLEVNPEKKQRLRRIFRISERELEAAGLEDLILERIASLSLL